LLLRRLRSAEGSPAVLAVDRNTAAIEVQQFRSRRDALEMRKQTLSARIEGIENDRRQSMANSPGCCARASADGRAAWCAPRTA
jgi:hypothetical protein